MMFRTNERQGAKSSSAEMARGRILISRGKKVYGRNEHVRTPAGSVPKDCTFGTAPVAVPRTTSCSQIALRKYYERTRGEAWLNIHFGINEDMRSHSDLAELFIVKSGIPVKFKTEILRK
jgi:hypothetical protein